MNEMRTPDKTEIESIRERLSQLNTKAYYLLVALSFIYSKTSENIFSLKLALALTAVSAVLPVQDLAKGRAALRIIQGGKIVFLALALASTLYWIIFVAGAINHGTSK
ncbi:MAG TPA: hypothetical protein VMU61_03035 [Candidatus Aquilonibacter sp.]|nr:hypothetical protein [Candidatus Aquilonibacter sp.]